MNRGQLAGGILGLAGVGILIAGLVPTLTCGFIRALGVHCVVVIGILLPIELSFVQTVLMLLGIILIGGGIAALWRATRP